MFPSWASQRPATEVWDTRNKCWGVRTYVEVMRASQKAFIDKGWHCKTGTSIYNWLSTITWLKSRHLIVPPDVVTFSERLIISTRYVCNTVICSSMEPGDVWLGPLFFGSPSAIYIYDALGPQNQLNHKRRQAESTNNNEIEHQATVENKFLSSHIPVAILLHLMYYQSPSGIKTFC